MPEPPKFYLDYIDKEMTIMGILSAFCLGIPALIIERVVSTRRDSFSNEFLTNLLSNGLCYLIVGTAFMIIASATYYRQRSRLAWRYGQIALETSLPKYTQMTVEEWLEDADSWEAWIPYNCAFWTMIAGGVEYLLAVLSSTRAFQSCDFFYQTLVPVILVWTFLLIQVNRNSKKYKFDEQIHYFRFR